MSELHLLGIGGSLRRASANRGLLRAAQAVLPAGVTMDIAELGDVPFYSSDIGQKPESVKRLLAQIESAQGLVLACPEYNYSIAPALKNALDWASREPDNHLLSGKTVAIVGAGGGMGTSRAQYHLRQVCVYLNLYVLNKPEVFVNAFTGNFDEHGDVLSDTVREQLAAQMQALVQLTKKLL
ncbi:NADPH-dependent FMN reductase [Orrella daihaiensis]|uniref:NAD(P)H-dependent oxidoreductase n=1 Tax=Orrella daihaiensis TaxID=2782176 RepID=A0ABY4ALW9_9BURK|nr:NADPH-dependent FMN reductase [Orrella daihaiensis]UOD51306.1 NAD(P)H-dependent oxidoreductase [Orrella daihaiensis]